MPLVAAEAAPTLLWKIAEERLRGLGGSTDAIVVETQLRLSQEEDANVVFHGQFAAVTALETLDMSVLGRDITGLFAVIIDRPANIVPASTA